MSGDSKPQFTTKVVKKFSQKILADILMLEKKCFSVEMQYEDASDYYQQKLKDQDNIHIFLLDGKKVIGYLLACYHNKLVSELNKYDANFLEQAGYYYIETIQVLPTHQGMGGAKKLLLAVCKQANEKGINKFSIHARLNNGLSGLIKRLFDGKIIIVRHIEAWEPAMGEPYEYIEWTAL